MRWPTHALLAAAFAWPANAGAQDTLPNAADLEAIEGAVPRQDWYPDGYYDIRIAAEAEIAESPRLAAVQADIPDRAFNLVACNVERVGADTADPLLQRYGDTALETARLRSELDRWHYPASLYSEPLLAFERDRLAADDEEATSGGDPYSDLADALEAARQREAPELPDVFAFDECTPPPPPPPPPTTAPSRPATVRPRIAPGVTFRTQPPAGEVLMISAFAFKVCVRKEPDPWDRFACRWNEMQTGIAKPLTGRFVYQVKWPDGTVRKGTREVGPGPTGSSTVTFRKVGS